MRDKPIRGSVPGRVVARGAPISFDFSTRFVVEAPTTDAERQAHDARWKALLPQAKPVLA